MKKSEVSYLQLGKFVERDLTSTQTEMLQSKLATSPVSRQRLARVQHVVNYLADTQEHAHIDLLPAIRRQIAALPTGGASTRHFSARRVGLALAAAVMAIVALPVYFAVHHNKSDAVPEGIRAKSAMDGPDSRERWIALNAFRLSPNESPVQIQETLHRDDGLLFSYTNLGPSPFGHLMVFAIDEKQQVYWYYPAFLDASDNPAGIPIHSGVSREGLQEVIAHPYQEGELTLFGLFSDTALSVSDIEQSVKSGITNADGFEKRFTGTRVKTLKVMVTK